MVEDETILGIPTRKEIDDEDTNRADPSSHRRVHPACRDREMGGSPEQAAGIHGMASDAFPVLSSIDAPKFLRALSGPRSPWAWYCWPRSSRRGSPVPR